LACAANFVCGAWQLPLHEKTDMEAEFACRVCGSPAVEYPLILIDEAMIRCRRCKADVGLLGEFRRNARARLSEARAAAGSLRKAVLHA